MNQKLKNIGIAVVFILTALSASSSKIILASDDQDSEFFAHKMNTKIKSIQAREGRSYLLPIRIKNTGEKAWISEGPYPVLLSYHLMDSTGYCLQYDNRRYPFPNQISPKKSITLSIPIKIPFNPGHYLLVFDLLREGKAWFEDYGSQPLEVELEILPNVWPDIRETDLLAPGNYTVFKCAYPVLNDLYQLIRLTLEENEITFRGKNGLVSGFAAGSDYPQIWLRDSQTILPIAKYFYRHEFLTSWIEEHLFFQREDGSLFDWFDTRGDTDKNTTETDQEASAVLAAGQVFSLLGKEWLEKEINGLSLINRLEKALDFVLSQRSDRETGLLTGAHTADWGDVDLVDPDQNAVYTDEKTQWTADIYDQSMFHAASLTLSRMFSSLGDQTRANKWKSLTADLRKKTNIHLWQDERGFYRVHKHLTPLKHEFAEEAMFAMGGNAQAILSGIAGKERSALIIRNALNLQKEHGLSTISGTLVPPYPRNTFRHPLLDDPYEYQNGAQWDWFGGRLVAAMFQNGFSQKALEKLLEIAEKNRNNRGFFEWDTRDGVGKGSDFFCGSAGVLGQAVIEEYFGVSLDHRQVNLSPRLGKDPGKIHVFIPALNRFLAYEYLFDSDSNKIIMDINSDFKETGRIRVLSPWENIRKDMVSVSSNRAEVDFRIEKIQYDVFIVFESALSDIQIEISLL